MTCKMKATPKEQTHDFFMAKFVLTKLDLSDPQPVTVIVGQRNCGKTSLAMTLAVHSGADPANTHVFTSTVDQAAAWSAVGVAGVANVMDFNMQRLEQIVKAQKAVFARSLVIFDDCTHVAEDFNDSPAFQFLVQEGRHCNLDLVVTSSSHDTPEFVKKNRAFVDLLCVFPFSLHFRTRLRERLLPMFSSDKELKAAFDVLLPHEALAVKLSLYRASKDCVFYVNAFPEEKDEETSESPIAVRA